MKNGKLLGLIPTILSVLRSVATSPHQLNMIDALEKLFPSPKLCKAIVYHRLSNKPTKCALELDHTEPCKDAASIIRDNE